MIKNFIEFVNILTEGKSLLTKDELKERDFLYRIKAKQRSEEQKSRLQELISKSSKLKGLDASKVEDAKLITQYSYDDQVDLSKIDVVSEYDKMRHLLYGRGVFPMILPMIPIKVKRIPSNVRARIITEFKGDSIISTFEWNSKYSYKYSHFLSVLAHECIHVYVTYVLRNIAGDEKEDEYHGPMFKQYMNKINALDLPFKVSIKDDLDADISSSVKFSAWGIFFSSSSSETIRFAMYSKEELINFLLSSDSKIKSMSKLGEKAAIYKIENSYFSRFSVFRTPKLAHYVIDSKSNNFAFISQFLNETNPIRVYDLISMNPIETEFEKPVFVFHWSDDKSNQFISVIKNKNTVDFVLKSKTIVPHFVRLTGMTNLSIYQSKDPMFQTSFKPIVNFKGFAFYKLNGLNALNRISSALQRSKLLYEFDLRSQRFPIDVLKESVESTEDMKDELFFLMKSFPTRLSQAPILLDRRNVPYISLTNQFNRKIGIYFEGDNQFKIVDFDKKREETVSSEDLIGLLRNLKI